MKGRDIALATLMREEVDAPCINFSWMTNSSYMSSVTGRDYWSDREGVFLPTCNTAASTWCRSGTSRGRGKRTSRKAALLTRRHRAGQKA